MNFVWVKSLSTHLICFILLFYNLVGSLRCALALIKSDSVSDFARQLYLDKFNTVKIVRNLVRFLVRRAFQQFVNL